MPAPDATPLPRQGEIFFDVRGESRSLRLSWYAGTGVAVFSIWHAGTCTGTFRLPIAELPRMVEVLSRGPEGTAAEPGFAAQERSRQRRAVPVPHQQGPGGSRASGTRYRDTSRQDPGHRGPGYEVPGHEGPGCHPDTADEDQRYADTEYGPASDREEPYQGAARGRRARRHSRSGPLPVGQWRAEQGDEYLAPVPAEDAGDPLSPGYHGEEEELGYLPGPPTMSFAPLRETVPGQAGRERAPATGYQDAREYRSSRRG